MALSKPRTRVGGPRLARMLGPWSAHEGPWHIQLSDALRELIRLGELPPTVRLPSERRLAEALAVSRTTVATAYESLRGAGWLTSRQGSGTWVCARQSPGPNGDADDAVVTEERLSDFLGVPTTTIDLSSAALRGVRLVAKVAASLTEQDYAGLVATHGYLPKGLPRLRSQVAQWFESRGVPTSIDQVLITAGAQQALEVVIAACLSPGDEVIVEDPTFRAAIQMFRAAGAHLRPIPTGSEGVDLDAFQDAIKAHRPSLAYLLPAGNNPTGSVLTEPQGRRLAELVADSGVRVIDDVSLTDVVFSGAPLPCLAAFADAPNIFTIGTLSKAFWGGLRVGWIRASAPQISRITHLKITVDIGASMVSQLLATHLFPHLEHCRELRREELTRGHTYLTEQLAEALPDWSWSPPRTGASLWVRLPRGEAASFTQVALRHGINLTPGPVFSASDSFHDHLRLAFNLSPSTTHTGIDRLTHAWHAYTAQGPAADLHHVLS